MINNRFEFLDQPRLRAMRGASTVADVPSGAPPPRYVNPAADGGLSPAMLFMFATSTAIMAFTGSLVVIAVWLGIWYLARSKREALTLLKLYIAFSLLYPSYPPGASSLQEYAVVKATLLGVVLIWLHRDIASALRESSWMRWIFIGWITWGTLGYLPVLITWAMRSPFGVSGWDLLGDYGAETSMSKTAMPVILAAVAATLPIAALKTPKDFGPFMKWLMGAATILIMLSTIETLLGRPFIPTGYVADANRMAGFSMPDPNGYARLLLMPTLFGIGLSLLGPKTGRDSKRWLSWLLAAGGVGNILWSQSRTAYIALAAGFLVLVVLNLRRTRTVATAMAILLISVVAFAGLGLSNMFAEGEERRSTANVASRLSIAENLVLIVRDKPWFGTHPGESYFNAMYDLTFRPEDGGDFSERVRGQTPHNQLLGLAAVWGAPMAFFYLAMWCATVVHGFRSLRLLSRWPSADASVLAAIAQTTIALAVAYFVEGLGTHLHDDVGFWVFGVSLALWLCLKHHQAEAAGPRRGEARQMAGQRSLLTR